MRLWHQGLLKALPRQQLLGQHRECCALRGKGWGKKHSVVDYVFTHPISMLEDYHQAVMQEMESRGYEVDYLWTFRGYRGKSFGKQVLKERIPKHERIVYPEHDDDYLKECIDNLKAKGIALLI
ncbi:MAG: hypothetical protein IIX53_02140 [Phascolarctobacterium sp.]|nr:hypothetical protein [Phascolarctobacterium sp.]